MAPQTFNRWYEMSKCLLLVLCCAQATSVIVLAKANIALNQFVFVHET